MTNALNSLKLELEQSDNKSRAVNMIHAQTDSIMNDETPQKSIHTYDAQQDDCQMLIPDQTESDGETEGYENVGKGSLNVSTIDVEKADLEAKKSVETNMSPVKINQDTKSVDLVPDTDENKIDISSKSSNKDEISKIQKLEGEMPELKNLLQQSQYQDGSQMLIADQPTEESTSTFTNISKSGEPDSAACAGGEIMSVQNSTGTETIAVEVSTDTISLDFVSDEKIIDVSTKTSDQDEIPVMEKGVSELKNSLQEIQCQNEKEAISISKSEPEKYADPEIHLDEITEKFAHLKLDEISNSPVTTDSSPSPYCEEINVPQMKESKQFMMEPENVREKLTATKSTNTAELTANQDDTFAQEIETLKEENKNFRKLNENFYQEIKILNGQMTDEKERYENARRKLKKKVFEYEKTIEEMLKSKETNKKAFKDLEQEIEKLKSEKQVGEHQLKELNILFEAQKQTIADIEISNNDLIQQNKRLESDKQLIETDNEKLKKLSADEKELNKNAKRKLKNKISEYEQKIGKDYQYIGTISGSNPVILSPTKNFKSLKSTKRIVHRRKAHLPSKNAVACAEKLKT